ncbi:hypothetical protein [Halococcus sp. AFM35]|uniref:hypothetical protein n=1 Tax=Halococcus sp. AFM35 TaxID=3421653 RepID=UPI003EBEF17F
MSERNQSGNGPNEVSSSETPETPAASAESQLTAQRFWLTNDLLAALLLVSFVGIVAAGSAGFADLTVVPEHVRKVYLSVVVTAAGWTFGEAAYRTWSGR